MSSKVWSIISDRLMESGRKHVLLKFADCGDDEGHSIYPKAHNVYKRCSLSPSTYRKYLEEFQAQGILIPVDDGKGGRGKRRHWKLDLAKIRQLFPHVDTLTHEDYLRLKAAAKKDPYGFWISEANGESGEDETCHPGGEFDGEETIHGNDEKTPPEPSKLSTSVDTEPLQSKPVNSNPSSDVGDDPRGSPPSDEGETADGETTLSAEWRALTPRVVEVIGEAAFKVHLQDAFPTNKKPIRYAPKRPIGIPEADVIGIQMAMADKNSSAMLNGMFRDRIFQATGVVLFGAVDPRAMGAKKRREEREAKERDAAQKEAQRAKRRRA